MVGCDDGVTVGGDAVHYPMAMLSPLRNMPPRAANASKKQAKRPTLPLRAAAKKKADAQIASKPPKRTSSKKPKVAVKKRGRRKKNISPPPPQKVSPTAVVEEPPVLDTQDEMATHHLTDHEEKCKIIDEATSQQTTNPVDEATIEEIISESNDLLRAAHEAQSLGRLEEAQSFLYLAHARLVGLGHYVEPRPQLQETRGVIMGVEDSEHAEASIASESNELSSDAYGDSPTPHYDFLDFKPPVTTPSPNSSNPEDTKQTDSKAPLTDQLAQTAMTLLHQRTGKGMQYEADLKRKCKHRKPRKKSTSSDESDEGTPTPSKSLGFHMEKESTKKHKGTRKQKENSEDDEDDATKGHANTRTVANCAFLNAQALVENGQIASIAVRNK